MSIIVWMFVLSILYHTGFAAMTPAIAGLFCRRTLMSPQTTKHRLKQIPHKSRPQRWCQTLWSIDPIVINCLGHSKCIHCSFYSYRMLLLSSLWFQMKIGTLPGGRDWNSQHKRGCNGPARAVPFMEAGRWFKVLRCFEQTDSLYFVHVICRASGASRFEVDVFSWRLCLRVDVSEFTWRFDQILLGESLMLWWAFEFPISVWFASF